MKLIEEFTMRARLDTVIRKKGSTSFTTWKEKIMLKTRGLWRIRKMRSKPDYVEFVLL